MRSGNGSKGHKLSWNQITAAAETTPALVPVEGGELLDEWAGLLETAPAFPAEGEDERRERLEELATATLSLTICGDVEGTITVDLPCDVIEEHPNIFGPGDGEPAPLSWVIARVESIEPIPLGSTQLTSFSIAIPGHVGPGFYPLDELRRRAHSDEVAWWEVDDFHLSPDVQGGESTFYLDDDAIEGAWVATTGASIAFDVPMSSVVSEVRVTGTIAWNDPANRPGPLVQTSHPR